MYECIKDGEVFYEEVGMSNNCKAASTADPTNHNSHFIIDNDMYEANGCVEKPKLASTYTEVRDVVQEFCGPQEGDYATVEDDDDGYAQVHRESLVSQGDNQSLMSQDSLYSEVRRQHKDLRRLCEPSPRHAPLLRRTRLAQLEASSSLSSGFYDSASTGDDGGRDTESEQEAREEDPQNACEDPSDSHLSMSHLPTETSPEDPPPVPPKHYRIPKDANIDVNFNFPEIPDLPHARRELAWDTPFDQIRLFIAKNRGPTEFYTAPKIGDSYGEGIEALKAFLETIKSDGLRQSRGETVNVHAENVEDVGSQGLEPLSGCAEIEITCL